MCQKWERAFVVVVEPVQANPSAHFRVEYEHEFDMGGLASVQTQARNAVVDAQQALQLRFSGALVSESWALTLFKKGTKYRIRVKYSGYPVHGDYVLPPRSLKYLERAIDQINKKSQTHIYHIGSALKMTCDYRKCFVPEFGIHVKAGLNLKSVADRYRIEYQNEFDFKTKPTPKQLQDSVRNAREELQKYIQGLRYGYNVMVSDGWEVVWLRTQKGYRVIVKYSGHPATAKNPDIKFKQNPPDLETIR